MSAYDDEREIDEEDRARQRSEVEAAVLEIGNGITTLESQRDEFEQETYDPFDGAKGTNTATLITLMRIYDVLLAQLSLTDDERANALMNKHAAGQLVASLPQLTL